MSNSTTVISLPVYGIKITKVRIGNKDQYAITCSTDWYDPAIHTDTTYEASVSSILNMILGHYHAGIDIETPAYLQGIESAINDIPDPVEATTTQVKEIVVTDPDTNLPVHVTILKEEGGGMLGVDSSFLLNTEEDVHSPFNPNIRLIVK